MTRTYKNGTTLKCPTKMVRLQFCFSRLTKDQSLKCLGSKQCSVVGGKKGYFAVMAKMIFLSCLLAGWQKTCVSGSRSADLWASDSSSATTWISWIMAGERRRNLDERLFGRRKTWRWSEAWWRQDSRWRPENRPRSDPSFFYIHVMNKVNKWSCVLTWEM